MDKLYDLLEKGLARELPTPYLKIPSPGLPMMPCKFIRLSKKKNLNNMQFLCFLESDKSFLLYAKYNTEQK